MRRILNGLVTGIALIFIIPTTLVLASWNAIPGDNLYSLKTNLENITLTALSGTPLLPKASIAFTDRRIMEATALLDKKGSTVGYDLLVANAEQTQTYISEKGNVQDAAQFSNNIDLYKKQIQQTKDQVSSGITTSNKTVYEPTPLPTPLTTSIAQTTTTNSQTTVVNIPTTITIRQENPEEVLQKLNQTEKKLNEIQKKVKENADHENQGKNNNNNSGSQGRNNGKDN